MFARLLLTRDGNCDEECGEEGSSEEDRWEECEQEGSGEEGVGEGVRWLLAGI